MASALQWIPESLYNSALSAVVAIYSKSRKEIRTFPENVQFDIYYKLYKQGRLCQLGVELCELDVFARTLKVNDKRHLLHHCFQALMDHGVQVSKILAESYSQHCCVVSCGEKGMSDSAIQLGFCLGSFLSDAGWFLECERVLVACLQLCKSINDPPHWAKALECCLRMPWYGFDLGNPNWKSRMLAPIVNAHIQWTLKQFLNSHQILNKVEGKPASRLVRVGKFSECSLYVGVYNAAKGNSLLAEFSMAWCQHSRLPVCSSEIESVPRHAEMLLHVRNAFCKFSEADQTYEEANLYVKRLCDWGHKPNLAGLYAEFSSLFFVKSHYDKAYKWSIEALKEITPTLPAKSVIDVLRQAAKACVVKRDFRRAEMLVKQAVYLARENFGQQHPKYSDALLDYGFYLLNIDSVGPSVQVYQTALDVRQAVFGGNNLHVAVAHEDLAYASYVHEYSSGKFSDAYDHAQKAMVIMTKILPEDHLLLASSKRVKALILEEIAIDNHDKSTGKRLLQEAQDLHLSALNLAQRAFGEMNVQTAKHYGNLGRLYQSMHRYDEAERMHLKAISIKEMLLGPDDYEVALSVGHLASLYNYDMYKYKEAELLYLRSISIAKKLFGNGYSGLEYDYRGLLRVHNMLGNNIKASEYTRILHEWKQIRDRNAECEVSPLQTTHLIRPTTEVIQEFFLTHPATLAVYSDTSSF